MSQDAEALVRRLYESAFDPGVVREVVAPDLAYHLPAGEIGGRAALLGGSKAFRSAFPDLEFSIVDLRLDGDEVEVKWRVRGTHEGDFAGFAPTGREIAMSGRHVERVVDGQIVERWGESDHESLMQQLREG